MIIDKQTLLSEDQAVTVSAASTNVIDFGAVTTKANIGKRDIKEVDVWVEVTTAFAGGTSLQVTLQSDDNASFTSATTVQQTAAIATASLVAGYPFKLGTVPVGMERYARFYYTVVGTMSAGNISAGFILDRQTNNSV